MRKTINICIVFILNILFINLIQSLYLFAEVNFNIIPFYFTYISWIVLAYLNVNFIYKKRTDDIVFLATLTLLVSIVLSLVVNLFDLAGGIYIIDGSSNTFIKNLVLSLLSYNTVDTTIIMILSLIISFIIDFKNESNWKKISNFHSKLLSFKF